MDPLTIGLVLTGIGIAATKGVDAIMPEESYDTFCYEYVHKGIKGQRCMAIEIENPTSASGSEPAKVTVYWDADDAN